jgi:hypothetical protein
MNISVDVKGIEDDCNRAKLFALGVLGYQNPSVSSVLEVVVRNYAGKDTVDRGSGAEPFRERVLDYRGHVVEITPYLSCNRSLSLTVISKEFAYYQDA